MREGLALRVRVVRTGGVAGLRVEAELDTQALEEPDRHEAERLVQSAMPPGSGPRRAAVERPPAGADRLTYEVTLGDGPGARTLEGDEASLPEAVLQLARFVVRRGRRAP